MMKISAILLVTLGVAIKLCQGQNKPAPPPAPAPRPMPMPMPRPAQMPVPRPPPIKPAPMPVPVIPKYPGPPPKWRFRRSPDDKKTPGGFGVDVYEEDKVGVVGKVHGHGTVWQSDDGKSRVQAHGQWSKVLDGPQRSKPHHNAGISFSHDFR